MKQKKREGSSEKEDWEKEGMMIEEDEWKKKSRNKNKRDKEGIKEKDKMTEE